jgi:alkanesulfonate monooxygenase SsuD/methylene tetrahydromethanopterin reductase-like flavin-dependent oxidoreductase (luciferase family)
VSIVKYVPCSVHRDAREARGAVKPAIGAMLKSYWKAYETSPAVRSTIADNNEIEPDRFAQVLHRLGEGGDPLMELDDGFVAIYAVAGTAEQCLEQAAALGRTGVTELVLSFVAPEPETELNLLAAALGGR